jgi:Cu/Ag efflux pump CusA
MVRWIVDGSVRARRTVVAVVVALAVLGVWQFQSAAEVEQLITVPLEQDLLNGVAWLDTIRSQSVPGLSSIELVFERGTPIVRARQVVQERLTQAHALPNVSSPPQMLQPVSSTSRVLMVGLSSSELSAIDLSVLARWTVRPKLLGVEGVANVAIFGLRERQLQVQVDPVKLQAQGVTLDQVIATAGNALWVSPLTFLEASTPGTGGFIDTPNQRLGVQHILPIDSPEDLEQVIVEGTATSAPLRLGDVTTVVEDHQPLIGDALAPAGGPSLLVVIDKFPSANTADVTEGVEAGRLRGRRRPQHHHRAGGGGGARALDARPGHPELAERGGQRRRRPGCGAGGRGTAARPRRHHQRRRARRARGRSHGAGRRRRAEHRGDRPRPGRRRHHHPGGRGSGHHRGPTPAAVGRGHRGDVVRARVLHERPAR